MSFTGETARRAPADFRTDARLPMLAAMALVVGSAGAFAAWLLIKLIALVTNLVWFGVFDTVTRSLAHATRGPWMVAAPALGGLAIGVMARFGSEKIRGHGIPEAIEAILIGGSRLSARVAVLKPISSALSIGTGGPFGAEGPIIMTGGAFGSLFAQSFHLSAAERKTLLVAGAAAGMTGIFGTPVAAVLLAVELLLFEWRPRSFIPVAVAALTAICWRPVLFGGGTLFAFGGGAAAPGLLACAGLGLLSGALSAALSWSLYRLEDLFAHLKLHWMWWPAIGGVAVGLGGLAAPRALGVGYDVIRDLLSTRLAWQAVALILAVKAAIWLIALASGTSGGVLAPLLILGAAAGWLAGHALGGPPPVCALLGMAAMLGGTMRAPLTGAVFALEITGEVRLLPALLAATVTAYAVTVLLLRRSILTEKIARRGQHVTCEYGIDAFELTRVGEVMQRSVQTLAAGLTADAAIRVIEEGEHRVYPVVDEAGRPVGLVCRADALRWKMAGDAGGARLDELVSDAAIACVRADDPVQYAIDLMLQTDQGRLPVVAPDSLALVGMLSRKDLLQVRAQVARSEGERAAFWLRGGAARARAG